MGNKVHERMMALQDEIRALAWKLDTVEKYSDEYWEIDKKKDELNKEYMKVWGTDEEEEEEEEE